MTRTTNHNKAAGPGWSGWSAISDYTFDWHAAELGNSVHHAHLWLVRAPI